MTENRDCVNSQSASLYPNIGLNRAVGVVGIVPGDTPGLLATVTIRVGGIVLRGVTVSDRGRGVYVNFPSRKVGDAWVDLVEIVSPALREHVAAVVLAAVRGAQ